MGALRPFMANVFPLIFFEVLHVTLEERSLPVVKFRDSCRILVHSVVLVIKQNLFVAEFWRLLCPCWSWFRKHNSSSNWPRLSALLNVLGFWRLHFQGREDRRNPVHCCAFSSLKSWSVVTQEYTASHVLSLRNVIFLSNSTRPTLPSLPFISRNHLWIFSTLRMYISKLPHFFLQPTMFVFNLPISSNF